MQCNAVQGLLCCSASRLDCQYHGTVKRMLLGIIRFLNLVISVSNIRLRYSGVIYDEHSSFIHFNNMEVPKEADSSENLHDKSRPGKLLIDLTRDCLVSATQYSNHTQRDDGHWCGELRANATISAEYVFLYQALELDLTNSRDPLCQWLLSQQQVDGSWSIAPDYPGDVSTTVEVYLALKILNISPNDPAMERARVFILGAGGVSKIRVFTRVYLALFGLFSWDDVPELPAELIFVSSTCLRIVPSFSL